LWDEDIKERNDVPPLKAFFRKSRAFSISSSVRDLEFSDCLWGEMAAKINEYTLEERTKGILTPGRTVAVNQWHRNRLRDFNPFVVNEFSKTAPVVMTRARLAYRGVKSSARFWAVLDDSTRVCSTSSASHVEYREIIVVVAGWWGKWGGWEEK
jgi:hypothetical protein